RVREAMALAGLVELRAMIDVSDGLVADVAHLCEESGCGARLHAEWVPIAEAARRMSDGRSPLDHALSDGEDFELAFAVSPADGQRLLDDQPVAGVTLSRIGEIVADGYWIERNGKRELLEPV